MNKVKQIIRDINFSEILDYKLKGKSKKVKDYIDYKFEELVKYEYSYSKDIIYYKKGDIVIFEVFLKHKEILFSSDYYWSFFEKEIGFSYSETKEFTKFQMRKMGYNNFKIKKEFTIEFE